MVDIGFVLMTILFLLVVWTIDRFVLARGSIILHNCNVFDTAEGYLRFALRYSLSNPVFWGQVRYQLRDKSNPLTVIEGKARSLEHSTAGDNHEYLLIKEALTATSSAEQWELIVVATTVVGNWNPLYKFFPCTNKRTYEVSLNG